MPDERALGEGWTLGTLHHHIVGLMMEKEHKQKAELQGVRDLISAIEKAGKLEHADYVEFMEERYRSYIRESTLKEKMIDKAEEANQRHFSLINGLQQKQDSQQREHTADLGRVRGEMASNEALAGVRGQLEERIDALRTWKIEQQAIQQQREDQAARRMWLVGILMGVFSILINLVIRLLSA